MRPHIHAPSAKPHALRFQPKPLFDRVVAAQLNFPARAKNSLPWQTERPMQHSRNLACMSRQTSCTGDRPISGNLAARNSPNCFSNACLWSYSRTSFAQLRSSARGLAAQCYAAAPLRNDCTASSSLSKTSKTVSSLVTCSRSPTRLVSRASLMDPSAFRAVV